MVWKGGRRPRNWPMFLSSPVLPGSHCVTLFAIVLSVERYWRSWDVLPLSPGEALFIAMFNPAVSVNSHMLRVPLFIRASHADNTARTREMGLARSLHSRGETTNKQNKRSILFSGDKKTIKYGVAWSSRSQLFDCASIAKYGAFHKHTHTSLDIYIENCLQYYACAFV